ncbi:proline dehydrogenase family protein [Paenibacillus sp. NEAU-GSW1]|uniref:proline dehydrogenase family protein n=1 Tax=Paenibacillus sp. NEAU-GSW1 TaxID=2682486 RepID=UPI0012E23C8F|nr:proline dehydrogenase family protein [Paenibacillus sp. NEAU-GSW1]MUT65293.1 proline dehydrogenase [Paenibacillus sp. NEAU-GSW1]
MDGTELYRKVMLTLSGSKPVKSLSMKYGKRLASRFIAGDRLEDALDRIEMLNNQGIKVTLDHLGEGIKHLDEASGYRDEYLHLVRGIANRRLDSGVSLKPTQMGLALDEEACCSNIRAVVKQANESNIFVTLDMEDSPFTDRTIKLVNRLHGEGLRNVGTVIQAYLFRSLIDVQTLAKTGVSLRLVKGAYKESALIAYQRKRDIIENYKRLIRYHLDKGIYTAIATHDDTIIQWVKEYARRKRLPKTAYEFQMLYGLRMNEQAALAQDGYRIRCYMPYGSMWYPYYTRRLAEKPSNLMLVLKNMFH